jgi:hypothetical protein
MSFVAREVAFVTRSRKSHPPLATASSIARLLLVLVPILVFLFLFVLVLVPVLVLVLVVLVVLVVLLVLLVLVVLVLPDTDTAAVFCCFCCFCGFCCCFSSLRVFLFSCPPAVVLVHAATCPGCTFTSSRVTIHTTPAVDRVVAC